ncbi:hypothetical protein AW736_11370 [Termitidicoccus mucosus]|uniref:Exo-alpha-sialidase n=1 Tax=Termitidicoccus mucosus TaxID=1184151 RepID=A0A178IKT2_9BACT|nr:hypothetical protein AW736_11370 [Opitutaceae bacterium TSB47]
MKHPKLRLPPTGINVIAAVTAFMCAGPLAAAPDAGGPIRPMASESILAESPDAADVSLYTPSITRLDSGRLVASYTETNRKLKKGHTVILTSDDKGVTWQRRAESPTNQGRLFTAGGKIYYIATMFYIGPGINPNGAPLCIQRSTDNGETWSEPSALDDRTWHQSAANVWHANGCVYMVWERLTINNIKSWYVGALAPVLMRARETDDLTKAAAWTYASEITFQDLIPGYKENKPDMDYFGMPFYPQSFPKATPLYGKVTFPPIGWLETNVVQITDPNHYWYDPQGRTFHLFARAHTGLTNYGALAKVVENSDGSMTTSLQTVPSGEKMLFVQLPGGHMRFHIEYDAKTKLYWLLGTQSTDSMTRIEKMPKGRYSRPDNERNRLVLHFSKNMIDWCFAGVVAIGSEDKAARHYACMAIDGDDLVIVSRSGDARAQSAHNGNLITFHRVENFRELVY